MSGYYDLETLPYTISETWLCFIVVQFLQSKAAENLETDFVKQCFGDHSLWLAFHLC